VPADTHPPRATDQFRPHLIRLHERAIELVGVPPPLGTNTDKPTGVSSLSTATRAQPFSMKCCRNSVASGWAASCCSRHSSRTSENLRCSASSAARSSAAASRTRTRENTPSVGRNDKRAAHAISSKLNDLALRGRRHADPRQAGRGCTRALDNRHRTRSSSGRLASPKLAVIGHLR
jgi:hypothetical protein